MKSATVKRNAQIVGHNSKSYDDKHPTNPISLRPLRGAIAATPKIMEKNRLVPDFKRIREIMSWHTLSKPLIAYLCNQPRH